VVAAPLVEVSVPVPQHFRFVFRGVLKGTEEIWSTSCHMQSTHELGTDAHQDDISVDDVDTAVRNFFGSSFFANTLVMGDWRAYEIGTNGKLKGNAPLLREYGPTELAGGGGAPFYPPQVAVVASTVAVNRGPAQFGRMYLPCPKAGIGADMRVTQADANDLVTMTTQFLKDISNAIDLPGTILSAAGVHVSEGPPGSSTGTLQPIDHVRVGRVYDTVRSRRNKLDEAYAVGGHIDW